jgi:hypothetical protein
MNRKELSDSVVVAIKIGVIDITSHLSNEQLKCQNFSKSNLFLRS